MSRPPNKFTIRAASAPNADALLSLMRELAIFEGHINTVTKSFQPTFTHGIPFFCMTIKLREQ